MMEHLPHPTDEWAERYVYGHIAWELLKEKWQTDMISVPGREEAWQAISEIVERPTASAEVNPTAAFRLLEDHQTEPSTVIFREPSGGIEIPLTIDAEVFNPALTKATRILLSIVRLAEFENKQFLDAFAGSGVLGIYAASRGAQVVAYDTSEAAVVCAEKNAVLHELTGRIAIRHGDITCLQEDEQFDIVTANPLPSPSWS